MESIMARFQPNRLGSLLKRKRTQRKRLEKEPTSFANIDLEDYTAISEIEDRVAKPKPNRKTKPIPGCGAPGPRTPALRSSENEPSGSNPETDPNSLANKDLEG